MPDFGIFRGFNDKLFGNKLYAGQLPTQLGMIGSQSFLLLLDNYPNAAAAYSLRKLRGAYTGSAIRVRRAVGSPAEKDIGFVNNELDVSDLQSFCSGTNGFVTTWYDQSGNSRDATQTTAANQPQIVSSGTILTSKGKPTIRYAGSQILIASVSPALTYNTSTRQSVYGVFTPHTSFSSGNYGRLFTQSVSAYTTPGGYDYVAGFFIPYFQDISTSNFGQYINGPTNTSSLTLNTTYLYDSYNIGSSKYSLGLNGATLKTTTAAYTADYTSGGGVAYFAIGSALSSPIIEKLYVDISETINYLSNQTSNRDLINTNINLYYGIY